MEAMALKRTVVGCDTYGTREVIGSDEFGYIYDHTSFEDLIIKTQMALNDFEKGPLARKRILENYDWRVVIQQIDKIYSELLNEKN
jgi:glycosyltransferase involved in cell wall biosynthesis